MWEFELIAERSFNDYFEKLTFKIADVIKSANAVSVVMADDNNIYLSIGCKDENIAAIKAGLRVALCDFICRDLKSDFISTHLNLNVDHTKLETLKTLCTFFDRELERSIVLQLLNLDKKINVISFYNFKLGGLHKKWLELCMLINQNASLILEGENFSDLIRFLLSSIDIRCESVILELKDKYIIYHDMQKNIDRFEPIQVDNTETVLSKLIELNPNLITVKNGRYCSSLVKYLKGIFMNRVRD